MQSILRHLSPIEEWDIRISVYLNSVVIHWTLKNLKEDVLI